VIDTVNRLQRLQWGKFEKRGVALYVWREDLNHPDISGNKWYKVAHHLNKAVEAGCSHVVSMGGPWSNHLHALAAACHEANVAVTGMVRGDALRFLSPTLEDALAWGMDLKFVDFETYRELRNLGAEHPQIQAMGRHHYFIPEGGSDAAISQAFKPLVTAIERHIDADYWVCPTGTGGTFAGLVHHAAPKTCILGVQAVAEGEATVQRISPWLQQAGADANWQLWQQFHRGGFGKVDTQLRYFIDAVQQHFALPLDPIYNGKTLLALSQALDQGFFQSGEQVVMIHTGGLQGCRGMARVSQNERDDPDARTWLRHWDF